MVGFHLLQGPDVVRVREVDEVEAGRSLEVVFVEFFLLRYERAKFDLRALSRQEPRNGDLIFGHHLSDQCMKQLRTAFDSLLVWVDKVARAVVVVDFQPGARLEPHELHGRLFERWLERQQD